MAFQPTIPLQITHRLPPPVSRRPRTRLCLPTPPSPPTDSSPYPTQPSAPSPSLPNSLTRRAFLIAAAALTAATFAPTPPLPADSLGLAPTPINPYARRRRERTYQKYAQELEQKIESVAVADFGKVKSAGGGGLGVSYRVAGFAAFVASALSTAVVHPLDSLKTRMQAGVEGAELTKGLYTGLMSNVMKEAPNAAIYLGVYELIKNALLNLEVTSFFHDLPLLTFLVAGALGDGIGSLVRVPAEMVNKRLQLGTSKDWKEALRDAFVDPVGRQGSLVAWQAVLLRDVPYGGLQIMFYEFGKLVLLRHSDWFWGWFAQPGVFEDVMVGAVAGAVAAMLTTPADVLVTKLSTLNCVAGGETSRPGVGTTVARILQEEGLFGLFKGLWQRGLYYAPMIGLFFALYELNRNVISHPEVVMAKAGEWMEPVTRVAVNEWERLPSQVAALHRATAPWIAALVSVLSNQWPMAAMSFASVNY